MCTGPCTSRPRRRMRERGEAPTPNRHNCSGKHTGMLANALHPRPFHRRLPQPAASGPADHPGSLCRNGQAAPAEVPIGIDGCSAPTFAAPLRKAAYAYALLADPVQPARAAPRGLAAHLPRHDGPSRYGRRAGALRHDAHASRRAGKWSRRAAPKATRAWVLLRARWGPVLRRWASRSRSRTATAPTGPFPPPRWLCCCSWASSASPSAPTWPVSTAARSATGARSRSVKFGRFALT